jgi:hypothetical protein
MLLKRFSLVLVAALLVAGCSGQTESASSLAPSNEPSLPVASATPEEVFDPVSVNCNGTTSNNHISTYPNPSIDGFYVSLYTETMEGKGQLSIMDGSGRTVYSKSVNIQDGNNVFHIGDLTAAPGMYYIQVSYGSIKTSIVKHSLR